MTNTGPNESTTPSLLNTRHTSDKFHQTSASRIYLRSRASFKHCARLLCTAIALRAFSDGQVTRPNCRSTDVPQPLRKQFTRIPSLASAKADETPSMHLRPAEGAAANGSDVPKGTYLPSFKCDLPIEPRTSMSAYGVRAVESSGISIVMRVTRGSLCGVAGRSRGRLASRAGTNRCPSRRER